MEIKRERKEEKEEKEEKRGAYILRGDTG